MGHAACSPFIMRPSTYKSVYSGAGQHGRCGADSASRPVGRLCGSGVVAKEKKENWKLLMSALEAALVFMAGLSARCGAIHSRILAGEKITTTARSDFLMR